MRRLPILLVFALMFALLAVAPASAVKPTPPATTPDCTDDILTGITGPGLVSIECVWTPTVSDLGVGTVTVIPSVPISNLVVFVLDSSPGDICVLQQEWDDPTGLIFEASFDLSYGELTEPDGWDPSNIHPDFSIWEGQDYWNFSYEEGGHWCYPQDGVPGMREDLNGKPLHLRLNFVAKKNTMVDVSLSPAQDS